MILELTPRCNYNCPYCYCLWHEFPELAHPPLDGEGWKRVIDKCVQDGVAEVLFTGGEALLRKDLFEIVSYARKVLPKARLTLFTNGSRLTEAMMRWFKRRKIYLAVSLQGLGTYAEMTGTRRKPNGILRRIARAAELKWPMIVSVGATRVNRHEIADVYAAAVLSGASQVQIGPMIAGGRGKKHLDMMLSRREWENLKFEIRALPDTGVSVQFVDEFICTCRPQPVRLLKRWANSEQHSCSAGKSFGVVGPNGAYRICLHAISKMDDKVIEKRVIRCET